MSFLSKIFKRKRVNSSSVNETEEFRRLMEFLRGIEKLLSKDKYIARSDYYRAIEKYNQLVSFFDNLHASDMLEAYCQKNCLDIKKIKIAMDYYHEIKDLQMSPSFISKHNEDYLNRHLRTENEYLDNINSDHLNPVLISRVLENGIRANNDESVFPAFNYFE